MTHQEAELIVRTIRALQTVGAEIARRMEESVSLLQQADALLGQVGSALAMLAPEADGG